MEVERISRLSIKEVWRYEDRSFTPWLTENIDVLGDAIGIQLTNAFAEQSTGSFSVDIKAEDLDGNIAIIENQFGNSDHDHLGKLITYLSSFSAKTAIWIVENPRAEHINAINWLNEGANNCNFHLIKVEAIKIGDSKPAPLFTKIVGPSEEAKSMGKAKKEDAERFALRSKFWELVLAKTKTLGISIFNSISPSKDTWVGAASGIKGLQYVFWLNQFTTRIELRIDRGKDSEEENLSILNKLKENQYDIETSYGDQLQWDELDGYRVCSIRKDFDSGGYKSSVEIQNQIVENLTSSMDKLIKATKPYINQFR